MFVNEMSDWRTIHEQKKQKKRFDNEIQFGDLNYDEDEDDESETIIDNSTTQMNQDENKEEIHMDEETLHKLVGDIGVG